MLDALFHKSISRSYDHQHLCYNTDHVPDSTGSICDFSPPAVKVSRFFLKCETPSSSPLPPPRPPPPFPLHLLCQLVGHAGTRTPNRQPRMLWSAPGPELSERRQEWLPEEKSDRMSENMPRKDSKIFQAVCQKLCRNCVSGCGSLGKKWFTSWKAKPNHQTQNENNIECGKPNDKPSIWGVVHISLYHPCMFLGMVYFGVYHTKRETIWNK